MVSSGLLAVVNAVGGLHIGYNSGVVAVALPCITAHYNLNAVWQGFFTTAILVGATVGSLGGGSVCDKLGRKKSVIIVGVLGTLGTLLTALIENLAAMTIGRAILGLGIGLATVVCPTYVSENAPEHRKGFLGTLFQLVLTFGIFLSYLTVIPWGEQAVKDGKAQYSDYRYMLGIGVIPGGLLLVLGALMPESPFWISKKLSEYDPLLSSQKPQIQESANVMDLLKPPTKTALYVGVLLAVAQQLTGINAIMYYAPQILKSANVNNAEYATIGIGAWNFITTFASTALVERLGRRPLLLFGTAVMTISTLVLAATYQFVHNQTAIAALSIILLLLFVAGFELGEGPLFWVVATELFKPEVKGHALSFLNACTWVFNIMLSFSFPPLSELIHESGVFWIFGGIGFICVTLMWFHLPETKRVVVVYEK